MKTNRILAGILILVILASGSIQNVIGHGNIDQSWTGPFNAEQTTQGVSNGIGQEFTPQEDNIIAVDIFFGSFGGSQTQATVKIRDGTIAGPILGEKTQPIVPGSNTVLNPLIAHFDFDSTISLTPGNVYVIEVNTLGQAGWVGDFDNLGNSYPDGIALSFGGIPLPNEDRGFVTYFEEDVVTVGGEFLPIEATSLLLANAQSFSWMIPVLLSGIGIGLVFLRKEYFRS